MGRGLSLSRLTLQGYARGEPEGDSRMKRRSRPTAAGLSTPFLGMDEGESVELESCLVPEVKLI